MSPGIRKSASLVCSLILLSMMGCGQADPPAQPATTAQEPAESTSSADTHDGPLGVTGQIMGTDVSLMEASFDQTLALFEADSWSSGPSVLIFLFLNEEEPLPERIEIRDGERVGGGSAPHVHFRWRTPEGQIQSDVAMNHYDMRLEFRSPAEADLYGRIELSIPTKDIKLSGRFQAQRR